MFYEVLPLWEKGEYNGADKDFMPTITVYSLDEKDERPAVIIFPGGGYGFTTPREGEPIALKFLQAGYNAFVVHYSVTPNTHPQPLLDATRAICMVKDNCKKWRVDKNKIGVCGFSAGAHLATSLCTHYMKPELQNIKGMEPGKNRPDLLIACYPVITGGEMAHRGSFDYLTGGDDSLVDYLSLEKHVHKDMPPVFMWHTFNDGAVPVENSLYFAEELSKKNIPCELHIFPDGPHGLATADKETNDDDYPHVKKWVGLCVDWLKLYF